MADQRFGTERDRSAPVSPPSVGLPRGGGAIRGIGEKFGANPVTGTGSMTVPLALSAGRAGHTPALCLSYDSGAGNGVFGLGWSLGLPQISRRTDRGLPTYRDDGDVFIMSGAEDLVPVLVREGNAGWTQAPAQPRVVDNTTYDVRRYLPRAEGAFARIERWTNTADESDSFWRVISGNNTTTWYGRTPESRVLDPADPTRIFTWLICQSHDDVGNVTVYRYKAEDSAGVDAAQHHERNRTPLARGVNRHLKRVLYGNVAPYLPMLSETEPWPQPPDPPSPGQRSAWLFDVVLDYGEHDRDAPTPDDLGTWEMVAQPFSSYRAGFEVRTYRLCRRVLMFHQFDDEPEVGRDCLVKSTVFDYVEDRQPLLRSVSHVGHRPGRSRALPPVQFEYSAAMIDETVREIDPTDLPEGIDGTRYRWADLDGEGLSGVLTEQGDAWFYLPNRSGGRLGPARRVPTMPARVGLAGQHLLDLSGGGRLDLAVFDGPTPGFYQRDTDQPEADWRPFVAFERLPNVDFSDPDLRFVDLTGDGRPDVLVTGGELLTWYPSLGEDGFGAPERVRRAADEEHGPRLVFADDTQSVYLADMSGDCLTDLVRIRNGDVCYWPNLGYGRFGAKVSMSDAPWFDAPDRFDQARVRLADLDGSGPTDLIYLGADRVDVYVNRNGNGWSPARSLTRFPRVDDLSTVSTVDLLGNGTACLVWSSPLPGAAGRPVQYIDIMGGRKPHLLVAARNNLGTSTTIDYAASTRFALADRAAGRPWQTRLPFPVHVVEKVTVHDHWRGTRFASTYSYHHGYFDPVEREFRGFGRVEQTDVETFEAFADANADSTFVTDDPALYQPPVKTVTWHHTGVYAGRRRVLGQLAGEYYHPAPEHALGEPDVTAVAAPTAQEWREALRACRGILLRQEVYELDVAALRDRGEHVPVRLYSTTYHGCEIRMLQPAAAGNPHAVFHATESESVHYDYELDLRAATAPDPRVTHAVVLETDPYGRPVNSAAAVYPRRGEHRDPALSPAQLAVIRSVQREPHLSRAQTRYTDELPSTAGPDVHRLPMPYEVRDQELTGVTPAAPDGYFTAEELRALPPDGPGQRLVGHSRTKFLRDDLQGQLPLGQPGALGLEGESYRLAFDRDQLDAVFGTLLDGPARGTTTARQLLNAATTGGYIHGAELVDLFAPRVPAAELDGQYWTRSGTRVYAADAAARFFLPEAYLDPYGARTSVSYDPYRLFPARTVDPVGNTSQVEAFDYRVLAARSLRDPNDNLSDVAFDVLGMVVASAVKGKGTEADDLSGLTPDLVDPRPDAVAAFCGASTMNAVTARSWLAGATNRFAYHLGEECDATGAVTGWGARPAGACAILRERHADPASPLQVSLQFSDGSGSVLMTKQQAEPERGGTGLRWIVAGKTVVNNKGKAVKQFEPYFSADFGLEEPLAVGVTPVMYYDAAGRLVRTELPDGTLTRVEFSPWHVTTFDANDTVAEPGNVWYAANSASADVERQRAAELAYGHGGTPSTVVLDSLGRDVVTIARNRTTAGGDDVHCSVKKLDTDGHTIWARDARGNLVTQHIRPAVPADQPADPTGYVGCYDLAGNALYESTMDAGERWSLFDAAGQPLIAWTRNQHRDDAGQVVDEARTVVPEYDAARRQVRTWLTINGGPARLVERTVYGESLTDAKARNLRGQVYQHFEGSGLLQVDRIDFSGKHTAVTRLLVRDFAAPVVDWQGDPASKLDSETFVKRTEFDAMGRVTRDYNWHRGVDSRVAVVEPAYNERGVLDGVTVAVRATRTAAGHTLDAAHPALPVLAEVRYNARGQKELVRCGNGTVTRYGYDPLRFRLTRLRTTRPGYDPPFPGPAGTLGDPQVLQHLSFTYDATGNVTAVRDGAFEPVFFNNQLVEAVGRYTYDALYRLVTVTGRESDLTVIAPQQMESAPAGAQFPVTAQSLRNYTEEYTYDRVGNLAELRHVAGSQGSWTRHYDYAADSNRLLRTWLGNDVTGATRFAYDAKGNILNLANVAPEQQIRWDHRDLVRALNLLGGGWAYYTYASDRRVRQVVTRAGGADKRWERIDLGGLDVYRRYSGTNAVVEEIESHHVLAGDEMLLLIDDVLVTDNANQPTGPLHRFRYADHQGSTVLELDAQARIISYEEFHPYGTSAYRATNSAIEAPPTRYRYTGVARDAESGLDYRGARYYAPWLARWLSCDPSGTADGPNRYAYARGSPVANTDRNGRENESTPAAGGNPFGAAGPYIDLATQDDWTREHLLPGKQMFWLLVQAFGKTKAAAIYGRLYRNAWAVQSPNTISFPKTWGETDLNDNAYTALLRADAKAGKVSDTRMWFLRNMRNIAQAMQAAGVTSDEETKQFVRKNATIEAGALFRVEVLLDEEAAGKPVPPVLAPVLRPQPAPGPAAPGPGNVEVVTFAKPGPGAAKPPPPAAPPAAAPPAPPPAAPPAAPPAEAKPAAPAPPTPAADTPSPPAGAWASVKSFGVGLASAAAPIILPMAVGLLVSVPFSDPEKKAAAATLGAGVAGVGLEWAGMIGLGTAASGVTALAGSTMTAIAAGGAGMVASAGVLVAAAGAVGYGVGTVINRHIVAPIVDAYAPGSGALGDWWYQHVLK